MCGTGGDASNTFNTSTTNMFVVAAAGVKVAKHGGRSASSSSGSADVLETLGARLDLTPEQVSECVERINIGFMYARSEEHTSELQSRGRVVCRLPHEEENDE